MGIDKTYEDKISVKFDIFLGLLVRYIEKTAEKTEKTRTFCKMRVPWVFTLQWVRAKCHVRNPEHCGQR